MSLTPHSAPATARSGRTVPRTAIAALALAIGVGGLVAYKASSALASLATAQRTGTLPAKTGWLTDAGAPSMLQPVVATANYLGWVVVALAFGIFLSAVVRALLPKRWLEVSIGGAGPRGQLGAALIGAPLMLCSCCVAPVFESVYRRTRRLAPALALMLAAPALNPAAHALTFLLFPWHIAMGRLVLSLVLVLGGGSAAAAAGRASPLAPEDCALPGPDPSWRHLGAALLASLRDVVRSSLPAILVGVVASAALAQAFPPTWAAAIAGGGVAAVLIVTAVATPLALPTFGEIPIGLALLAAGVPEGAVLALLVAGPSVNLPSLLTLRRAAGGRVALAVGLTVFLLSAAGGIAVGA